MRENYCGNTEYLYEFHSLAKWTQTRGLVDKLKPGDKIHFGGKPYHVLRVKWEDHLDDCDSPDAIVNVAEISPNVDLSKIPEEKWVGRKPHTKEKQTMKEPINIRFCCNDVEWSYTMLTAPDCADAILGRMGKFCFRLQA